MIRQVISSTGYYALDCRTYSTKGPSCWGTATVSCPSGYKMTGGGMANSAGLAFEESRPGDGTSNQWRCDNNGGCGSGTCYVRCCR